MNKSATIKPTDAWRTNVIITSTIIALAFICVALVNLFIDPYNIFHLSSIREGYTSNDRFNKIEHILSRPDKYDSVIVGSSRMGVFTPKQIEQFRPGKRYYNLSVYGGDALDIKRMLQTLINENVQLKEVFMGIDLFPYIQAKQSANPSYRHHPRVTGESRLHYFSRYLFAPSLFHSALKLYHQRKLTPDIVVDYQTGTFQLPDYDRRIQENHTQYIAEKFGAQVEKRKTGVSWYEPAFNDLTDLVALLQRHNIKLIAFIHPHHAQEALRAFTPENHREFVERITSIVGELPDFSINWQSQHDYFYDTSHYRPELAQIVLEKIFTAASSDEPTEEKPFLVMTEH